MKQQCCISPFAAIVFHIWLVGNNAYWKNVILLPDVTARMIKNDVISECSLLISDKWSRKDILLFNSIKLDV